jgi:putative Holliday junction resolvase
MRILGIDFGLKRIGLAVSDESGIIGHGIGTIRRTDTNRDIGEIKKAIADYRVEKIVIGMPKNMDGTLGKSAEQVLAFVDELKQHVPAPVETWDERLSTVAAERVLLDADMSRKKRKGVIDKVAASIILQNYLDHMNRTNTGDL